MKKNYILLIAFMVSATLNAQHFTNLEVVEVLASDDFEDDAAWVNFDQDGVNVDLNNALGGTQDYNWSDDWGGAAVHEGKSAINGSKCLQLHWGGTVRLQGFTINPDQIYQLEVMVHPLGGISDEWNNWGAVHLFIFDQSNVWQTQGVRIRISNNDASGGSPALLGLDVWEGEEGTERAKNLFEFSDQWNEFTIDDANDATPSFWIPLKLVFKGDGTTENPFIIDFYLNDKFVATQTFDDIYWLGDSMIGIQNGSDNEDLCRYDNFKLSVMSTTTNLNQIVENKISVSQPQNGKLKIVSETFGDHVRYALYNINGVPIESGFLINQTTIIDTKNIPLGVYILRVNDKNNGNTKAIRTVLK